MDLSVSKSEDCVTRPATPYPTMEFMPELRTPSILFNHGGYYAPADPKDCLMPGGPCSNCQERIDAQEVAEALVQLSQSCCASRPDFLEPCPECGSAKTYISHASQGLKTCNGCEDKFCTACFYGTRYCCAYMLKAKAPPLAPPSSPIQRQTAVGVQSPRQEETQENK
jgi:hypothetical protein